MNPPFWVSWTEDRVDFYPLIIYKDKNEVVKEYPLFLSSNYWTMFIWMKENFPDIPPFTMEDKE